MPRKIGAGQPCVSRQLAGEKAFTLPDGAFRACKRMCD
jgi:hypothetical protein